MKKEAENAIERLERTFIDYHIPYSIFDVRIVVNELKQLSNVCNTDAEYIEKLQEKIFSLEKENKKLRCHHDFSTGLYCIDKNPKDVDYKWVLKNAFQLKESTDE